MCVGRYLTQAINGRLRCLGCIPADTFKLPAALLHKRALAENNKSDFSAELKALRAELAAFEVSVSTMGGVETPDAGYFYSYTDGYESLCTTAAAKNISLEFFDELEAYSPQKSSNSVGKIASVGKW